MLDAYSDYYQKVKESILEVDNFSEFKEILGLRNVNQKVQVNDVLSNWSTCISTMTKVLLLAS